MKNLYKLLGTIALVAVIGLSLASCGDDGGGPAGPAGPAEPPKTAMYSGAAEDGSVYTLKVIEKTGRYTAQDGDSYIMYQVKDGETKTSSGTVTTVGTTLTLKPTSITISFTITINETGITSITGTITFDDKTEVKAPETIAPLPNVFENWPVAERWGSNAINIPGYNATISHSVDKDGVCAITVGGKAVPPLNEKDGTDGNVKYWNSIWRTTAAYRYTVVAGKTYTFTFEAWTDGLERALNFSWFWDGELSLQTGFAPEDGEDWENSPCPPIFKITSERKTYTITTDGPLPFGDIDNNIEFQCANQTGTFYVKMLSIDSFDAPITPNTLASYLATLSLNTPKTPYTIPITISVDGNNYWEDDEQFSIIEAALKGAPNKYVYLDFSRSNMTVIPGFAFTTPIGNNKYTGCHTLIGITIPGTVTVIGNQTFNNCENLAYINLTNSVTTIVWGAFAETGFTSITIPDSVTEMFGWEFSGCKKLANINIGRGLTKIVDGAFQDCDSYSSVIIPTNIKSIGYAAFGGNNLTSVTFQGTIPENDFDPEAFLHQGSDLREKYLAGGIGTYTRANGKDETATWTKQ